MKVIRCRLKEAGGVLRGAGVVYAKTVDAGRIGAESLADMLVENRSVSRSQVLAVLNALAEVAGGMMVLGHSVELPGLGYLVPEVKGRVTSSRSGNPMVSNARCVVSFRPKRSFLAQFDGVVYKPLSGWVRGNTSLSPEEAADAAAVLTGRDGVFSVRNFADEAGCSESYAARMLETLVERGSLRRMRMGRTNVFCQPRDPSAAVSP